MSQTPRPNGRRCIYCTQPLVGRQQRWCCHRHKMAYRRLDPTLRAVEAEARETVALWIRRRDDLQRQADRARRSAQTSQAESARLQAQADKLTSAIMSTDQLLLQLGRTDAE